MPVMPALAISSASASVATHTPQAPAASWRLAISTHLWALAWGADRFAGALHVLHHAREVGFEGVQIQQQGGG